MTTILTEMTSYRNMVLCRCWMVLVVEVVVDIAVCILRIRVYYRHFSFALRMVDVVWVLWLLETMWYITSDRFGVTTPPSMWEINRSEVVEVDEHVERPRFIFPTLYGR